MLRAGGVMCQGGTNGAYKMIETKAPEGYEKSKNMVQVVVDSTGVYANAGTAKDDITVQRGVGSIVHSMIQFATDDDVDKTLHDIKTELYTANEESLPVYDSKSWTKGEKEIHFHFQEGRKTLNTRTRDAKADGYYTLDAGWSKRTSRKGRTEPEQS